MLANDTNKLHCNEGQNIDPQKLKGKCPFDESDDSVMVSFAISMYKQR